VLLNYFCVDEEVVHEGEESKVDHIMENMVHHILEGCRGVGQPKGHDQELVKAISIRKKKLRPERPDALDALDVSDATCLSRTQIATASAYRTERGRVFSFWTQVCQGIFLLDAAVSEHFPSGRSRVRAFSYWTRPDDACYGTTFTLAVKARNIAANIRVAFANTQRVPGIVTQSSSILYIYGMYIYICYYTLRVISKSTQRHTHRRDHHMQ